MPFVVAGVTLVTSVFPIWERMVVFFVPTEPSKVWMTCRRSGWGSSVPKMKLGSKEETLASPFNPISRLLWQTIALKLLQVVATDPPSTPVYPPYPGTWPEFRVWFADEAACVAYLERLRWATGFRCPKCAHAKGWRTADGRWSARDVLGKYR